MIAEFVQTHRIGYTFYPHGLYRSDSEMGELNNLIYVIGAAVKIKRRTDNGNFP